MKRFVVAIMLLAMGAVAQAAFADVIGRLDYSVSTTRVDLAAAGTGSFSVTVPGAAAPYAGVQYVVTLPEGVAISSVSYSFTDGIEIPPQAPSDDMIKDTFYFGYMATTNKYTSPLTCTVNVTYAGSTEIALAIKEIKQYWIKNGVDTDDLVSDRATSISLAPYGSGGGVTPSPTPPIGGGGNGGGGLNGTATGSQTPAPTPTQTPSPTPAPTPTPTLAPTPTLTPTPTLPGGPKAINDGMTPLGISFHRAHVQFIFGDPDGSVRPDASITRAEAVTVFYRLIDDGGKQNPLPNPFPDVPGDEWYAGYVSYAANKGIVLGYPDGSFRPADNITRAEFATIMSRFVDASVAPSSGFADVPSDHWAKGPIDACAANGWIEGYMDGTFRPENPITRAEAVTILNRALSRGVALENVPPTVPSYIDLPRSHWAYTQVIEASVQHEFTRDGDGAEIWGS